MNNYSLAVIIVCFDRLNTLDRLFKSVISAKYPENINTDLIFSIDNSGCSDVEEYAKKVEWTHGKKIIRTFPVRQGLKNHILKCGEYTNEYDIIIVLEDDLIVSDSYALYAYNAASFYFEDKNVAGISLYNFQKNWLKWEYRFEPMKDKYDTYFMRIAQSWGQAWTKNTWHDFIHWYNDNENFDMNDSIPSVLFDWPDSSWLKYYTRYCIETDKYFVYPYYSFSSNCGNAGEHSKDNCSDYQVELQIEKETFRFPPFSSAKIIYDEYMNRIGLERYIGLSRVLIDMYGTRKNIKNERYVLTTKKINKKILKTYSLSYHPIEYSVIFDIQGDGIYLYDMSQEEKNRFAYNENMLLEYTLRIHQSKVVFPFFKYLLKKDVNKKMNFLFKKNKRK